MQKPEKDNPNYGFHERIKQTDQWWLLVAIVVLLVILLTTFKPDPYQRILNFVVMASGSPSIPQ
jgi:hypothetical protein